MNSIIHSSFPTPYRRYDDFFNLNRQDGGSIYPRRRSQQIETAVSANRDGGLDTLRRRTQSVETAKTFNRKYRSATQSLPFGGIEFSDSMTFIRSEQRKMTGGIRL